MGGELVEVFLLIFWAVHDISQTFWPTKIPPGVRWVNCFTWEWVPYLSEYVCQIWLRYDGRVKKRGVQSTDRQTDKRTLQLYIVDVTSYSVTPYYVTSDYFTVSFAYGWLSYQCYPIIVFTTNDSSNANTCLQSGAAQAATIALPAGLYQQQLAALQDGRFLVQTGKLRGFIPWSHGLVPICSWTTAIVCVWLLEMVSFSCLVFSNLKVERMGKITTGVVVSYWPCN